MKEKLAKKWGFGYSARDIQKAEYRGFDQAVDSIMDSAYKEAWQFLAERGARGREVVEMDEIEFRVPREAFRSLKIKLKREWNPRGKS